MQDNNLPETSPVSPELQSQIGSLKVLVQTHQLLQAGSFPYGYQSAIEQSLQYISSLHKQLLVEVTKHPEASSVPELAAFIQKSEEVQV